ncbi:cold-responsive protein kinase 1-like [Impatiens glandulifera]|uniref:cold-responsive protein kinase 1-like n=1 Tax=Impatiens glandulifera TaxID=253017 RepID=UPI001FB04E81|nr:cold-responsive protein kinase 1-like [Impatiens glandulifera]
MKHRDMGRQPVVVLHRIIPVPASPSNNKIQKQQTAIVFFFLGALLVLLILIIIIIILLISRKLTTPSKHRSSAKTTPIGRNQGLITYFEFHTLKKATNKFHETNLLGRGGFGSVYRGKLIDGRMIAVKQLLHEKSHQGESEFLAEVSMITIIQHKNLVRLHGCCIKGKQQEELNWNTRFQIIIGVARGLQYLHEDSPVRIVHRDIKANNILLDDKFQPKISDFGLARFFPDDQAYLSTNFAGTLGYTAPEYAIRGELTEKADIYSFGVVVLEIICGRKNTDLTQPREMQYLPEYAWRMRERRRVLELLDPKMKVDVFCDRDVMRAIDVAFLCIQPRPNARPPMSQIVALLTCRDYMEREPKKEEEMFYWDTISEILSSSLKTDSP